MPELTFPFTVYKVTKDSATTVETAVKERENLSPSKVNCIQCLSGKLIIKSVVDNMRIIVQEDEPYIYAVEKDIKKAWQKLKDYN